MKRAREGIEQADTYPEPNFITEHKWRRRTYRFLLGRPMDGRRWTDSTFWRSATRGEDHWWLRLAGWHRAAIRVSALYVLAVFAPVLSALAVADQWRAFLYVLGMHAALAVCVWIPAAIYRRIRRSGLAVFWLERFTDEHAEQHWRVSKRVAIEGRELWLEEKVRPVARTVAAKLNRRYHPAEAAQWVSVPRDYREPGGGAVEILLPAAGVVLTEAARRSLANAAAERLGVRDPQYRYELEGNAPRLVLTAPVLPPDFVSYADMLPHLERTEEYTFVLGMAGAEALRISLKDDSPHLALSAGSGAGKSELIKALVAQAMKWGWFILILDWKGESQEWAEGMAGVRYVRGIAELHDACVSIGEEVDFRTENRAPEQKAERRKMLIVSEEWGITAPLLTSYWSNLRSLAEPEERKLMPLRSPAAEGLMKLNFTGRSLGMTQLLVAQRFSARVTNGNADLRESFSTILMSRWKAQTFKMLAPDVRPIPKKLTKPGQWLAVTGDEAVRFQAGLWTNEEAREWADSGEPRPMSPWSARRTQPAVSVNVQAADLGFELRPDATGRNVPAIEAPLPKLLKLSDLAESLEPLGITHNILRNAAREDEKGDPDFPKPEGGSQFKGYRYDKAKVLDWARRRRAQEAARRDVA